MSDLIKRIDAVDYGAISGKLEILLTDCRAEIQRLLLANETLKGLCEEYQAQIKAHGIEPPDGWVLVPLSDLENMRFQIDETVSKLIFEMLASAPKQENSNE